MRSSASRASENSAVYLELCILYHSAVRPTIVHRVLFLYLFISKSWHVHSKEHKKDPLIEDACSRDLCAKCTTAWIHSLKNRCFAQFQHAAPTLKKHSKSFIQFHLWKHLFHFFTCRSDLLFVLFEVSHKLAHQKV